MSEVIESIFAEPLPMDKNNSYHAHTVNVYYENRKLGCVFKIDLEKTIRDTISEKG